MHDCYTFFGRVIAFVAKCCKDVNIPTLYMNDDVLEDVIKHKHLGINFCPNGTWKDHIDEIYKKNLLSS